MNSTLPSDRPSRPPLVVVMINLVEAYGRGIARGIMEYARTFGPWDFWLDANQPPDAAPGARVGVIAQAWSASVLARAQAVGAPLVNVSAARADRAIPRVVPDNHAVGRAAAEHLLTHGFRRLAYSGMDGFVYSAERRAGFAAVVETAGFTVLDFAPLQTPRPGGFQAAEEAWLAALPRPVGILACNDRRGRHLLNSCAALGIRVPQEVAVVGVDDDELQCEMAAVPLSSVALNTRRIGFEAAALLDRLLRGDVLPPGFEILVPPLGVVTRHSSDILAVPDPEVAAALEFIRDHAAEPIDVEDVVRHVAVSRRVLERRFRKHLGHLPHDQIIRVRMDRAKRLLSETNQSIATVAHASGYRTAQLFSMAFSRFVGVSPRAYRLAHTNPHPAT